MNDKQLKAVDLLVTGLPQSDVANLTEVDRTTLWRWQSSDTEFIAILNQRRREIWLGNTDRLRSLVGKSLEILDKALDSRTESVRVRAALAIVKMAAEPTGETEARRMNMSDIDRLLEDACGPLPIATE